MTQALIHICADLPNSFARNVTPWLASRGPEITRYLFKVTQLGSSGSDSQATQVPPTSQLSMTDSTGIAGRCIASCRLWHTTLCIAGGCIAPLPDFPGHFSFHNFLFSEPQACPRNTHVGGATHPRSSAEAVPGSMAQFSVWRIKPDEM